ncbi:MAG: arginine-tRNA-protein transferase [Bacteroidetes bacterium]|nr:MAG: arginine-tRNA-protein transferase [Bacteroidota bacterium]TAG89627.1 MAG: arginine-tRNA-protein transferase [Bacteroidota bacterium]
METYIDKLEPNQIDILWANGWRNFGIYFFKETSGYNPTIQKNDIIIPLRIYLPKFTFQKSHLKILKKNKIMNVEFKPIVIDEAKENLFQKHAQRFSYNVPTSLYDFLSEKPESLPYQGIECAVHHKENNQLCAVSFVGVGKQSLSSIYAMFDTDYSTHSLGIFTLLAEIEYGKEHNFEYLYLGYAYQNASFYDYKKKFNHLQYYDWKKNWLDFSQ